MFIEPPIGRKQKRATVASASSAGLLALAAGGAALTGFDWTQWGLQLTDALIPLVTIMVMYYARLVPINVIPPQFMPLAAVVVGMASDYLTTFAGSSANPVLGAALGGLAALLYKVANDWVGTPKS